MKNRKTKPDVQVSWVHPGTVHEAFMESVLALSAAQKPFSITMAAARSGPLLSKARNMVAETFMESRSDYLLFVDTDIVFTPKDVLNLYAAKKDIVGALYFGAILEDASTFPVALRFQDGAYRPIPKEEIPESGCIKVDSVGMGLTLIHRDVFEALPPDHTKLFPFAEMVIDDRAVGEDVAFCLRAKQEGFTTWLCGDARVGHAKTLVIGG